MSPDHKALAQSLQARLVRHAKEIDVDPNFVLTRFAVERFLYRLSRSPYSDRFVLKGALLLLVWLGETIRPTRDADVLGFGDLSEESLKKIFAEICDLPVEADGITYDAESIQVADIRAEDAYGGRRVLIRAALGSVRLRVQVDVGIGDAIDPEAEWLVYPSLLDLPQPRLRSYPQEVVVAEKLHAMVVLGARNSRMRDYFDIEALARSRAFLGPRLVRAIRATFERRSTPVPETPPLALTPAFARVEGKQAQWRAFLEKNRIVVAPMDLERVVLALDTFLWLPMEAAREGRDFDSRWTDGGPWM